VGDDAPAVGARVASGHPFELVPGRNCWATGRARRAAVLVDADAYFGTLYDAFRLARRRICIAGWDLDSRVMLTRTPPPHGPPPQLGPLLDTLVRTRPELEVYLLAWDFSTIYLLEREAFPRIKLGLCTHARVRFHLDHTHDAGASHHQKLVVVDDTLAFCGGLDLCDVRWDTPAHRVPDPARADVHGRRYGPHHDVQLAVEGPVAATLGRLFARRWHDATERCLPPLPSLPPLWPPGLVADFCDVEIGVARTSRGPHGEPIHEVEAAWLDAIWAARARLYIEVCYLTAPVLVDALERRLAEPDGPRVVLVAPREHGGWLEDSTMLVVRDRYLERLRRADVHGHLRAVGPAARDPADPERMIPIKVHSKVVVVDDLVLKIGSANATRRSFRLDSECDLVLVARREADRRAIRDVVRRLLADHLDATPADADAWLHGRVAGQAHARRSLGPLPPRQPRLADRFLPAEELVDPHAPLCASQVWKLVTHADGRGPVWATFAAAWWLGAVVIAVITRVVRRLTALACPRR
jgi:phospholipase D1/2